MGRKILYSIFTILFFITFIFSCNLDTNREFYQDSFKNETQITEDRCINNNVVLSNIETIENFLKDFEKGKDYRLLKYLANDIEWVVAGNLEKVPFAGDYHRIREVNRFLRNFYHTIKISDLITTTLTEPQSDYLEAYIRLEGSIRSTKRTIDIEFFFTWQFNSNHTIEKITITYPFVSMELACTQGGKGKIVSDVYASPLAITITNALLPIKARIGNPATTLEQLRSPYTPPPLPSDAILEQVVYNGVPGDFIHITGERADKIVLHLHGGAFISLFPGRYRSFDYAVAKELNIPVLNIDYRLAPENPFSAGLEDCYNVYQELLSKYDPKDIILLGDSAGGGLVFSLMLLAKEHNLSLPGVVVALSPWVDLTNSGETMTTNADSDTYLPKYYLDRCAAWYLNGASAANSLASPLFGGCCGFPPVYITASTTEILLSDSTRMFNASASNRVDVTIEIASGLCHDWPGVLFGTSDAAQTITRIGKFVKDKLNLYPSVSGLSGFQNAGVE